MQEKIRTAVPWLVAAIVAVGLVNHYQWFGSSAQGQSGPAKAVPLAGGGVSDGNKCGVKGYHFFPLSTVTNTGGDLPGSPAGPQLVLGAYGAQQAADGSGYFTIALLLSAGSTSLLDLSAPLGPQGVAVEIQGPDGLIGGAHNLPVTADDPSARLPNGKIRIGPDGLSVEVKVPDAALCPGYNSWMSTRISWRRWTHTTRSPASRPIRLLSRSLIRRSARCALRLDRALPGT